MAISNGSSNKAMVTRNYNNVVFPHQRGVPAPPSHHHPKQVHPQMNMNTKSPIIMQITITWIYTINELKGLFAEGKTLLMTYTIWRHLKTYKYRCIKQNQANDHMDTTIIKNPTLIQNKLPRMSPLNFGYYRIL